MLQLKNVGVTHRDLACLFKTPKKGRPLVLWDISSLAPPGLAVKWQRGIIRAQSQSAVATCVEQNKAFRRPVKTYIQSPCPWPIIRIRPRLIQLHPPVFIWIRTLAKRKTLVDINTATPSVCQTKQMWTQSSYVAVVFWGPSSSPRLAPSPSTILPPLKAHGAEKARHFISLCLSKWNFHTAQFSWEFSRGKSKKYGL